jgi:hypothetical protein
MHVVMTDFYSAKMVDGARSGMSLLVLHGYMDNSVVVECSDACLANIHAVIGAQIAKTKAREEAELRTEADKAEWIARHLYNGGNHEAV